MSPIPRPKLLALLAQFHISPVAFDALRADAYEKHLAARSLAELEQFYETLFNPALTYRQMRSMCPPWDLKKYGGRRPSIETLREIKQRVSLEQHLHQLAGTSGLLDSVKTAAPGDPDGQRSELLNAAVAMLSQELLFAKLAGKPILENLRVVDRLLRVESLRVRQCLRTPPAEPAKVAKEKPERPVTRSHAQRSTTPARPQPSSVSPASKAPPAKENPRKDQVGAPGPNCTDHAAHKHHKINAIARNHTPKTPLANPALSTLVNLSQPDAT